MAACLKVLDPPLLRSSRVGLPPEGLTIYRDGPTRVGFEAKRGATKEAHLYFENGLWRAQELGELRINGVAAHQAPALEHGDLLSCGAAALVFHDRIEAEDAGLEAAIAHDPTDERPWLVYADWLQEHGDPLGTRIVRALRGPPELDEDLWLDGLWREVSAGQLELKWERGVIAAATVRESNSSPAWARQTLLRLLDLRCARFLRELTVDLQALDPVQPPSAGQIPAHAAALVAQLPALPLLERLRLGYQLEQPGAEALTVGRADRVRFPRLGPAPIFEWPSRASFEVLEVRRPAGDAVVGERLTAPGLRIEITGEQVRLRRMSLIGFRPVSRPCQVTPEGPRAVLSTGAEKALVDVNGHHAERFALLPGDLISIWNDPRGADPIVRLRFGLER